MTPELTPPADELQERGDLKDRAPVKTPAQKALITLTIILAIGMLLYAALKLSGILHPPKALEAHSAEAQKRPVSVPDFAVSMAEPRAEEPRFVLCAGGLKLPLGMSCPPAVVASGAELEAPSPPDKPAGPTQDEIVQLRRFESEVGAAGRHGQKPAGRAQSPASASALAGSATSLNGSTDLGAQLLATATATTRASRIVNPSLTMGKGTLPDCTLITAISTDQPGFIKCVSSRPVYSMDGKVILMEAGTTFEGEYGAEMARGKKRIFALWTRAITPQYVVVPLNSPSSDALGRSGIAGGVDNHFLERFGGAMLYSLFSDYTSYLTKRSQNRSQERQAAIAARGQGSGNSVSLGGWGMGAPDFGQSQSTADMIVESMLKQGEDIQPTLNKNQGDIIKIYVARDIDFSQVYALDVNQRE